MNDRSGARTPLALDQDTARDEYLPASGSPVQFTREEVEQSIPERFEKIVRQYPYRLALKMGNRSLSYNELNETANRIAHAIVAQRGGASEPIVLLFEHGIDLIAALFGVLKSGKFYVVIEPSFPLERMTCILEDSGGRLILTNNGSLVSARKLLCDNRSLLNIDEINPASSAGKLGTRVSADQPALISYTSGSTGEAKGVLETHRFCLHHTINYSGHFAVCPDDRLSLVHSLSFVSAEVQLYRALLNGASLLPFSIKSEGLHRLANWLRAEKITVCHLSPATLRGLVDFLPGEKNLPSLRVMRLSGAPITRADFESYKKNFSQALLEVAMGSTETGTICCALVNKGFSFPETGTPVGYGYPGTEVRIVDENGEKVNRGGIGEIAVRSRYLSTGYWKKPALTRMKFRYSGDERLYLTGDLGRMSADGFVVHLGRKDFMVKVRGYRVEISEVERVLLEHSEIRDAGIVAWDGAEGKSLVAYVVPRQRTLTTDQLMNDLRKTLPDYMIPRAFVWLETLPLTNGKLDRQALPKPDAGRPQTGNRCVHARNEIQQELVTIWKDVFKFGPIGIEDNFFDLGGHSLLGASLIGRLEQKFNLDLPVRLLFEAPTVAKLAERIQKGNCEPGRQQAQESRYIVTLHRGLGEKRIFCFPYRGGFRNEYFNFTRLARLSGGGYSFYGLCARGANGRDRPRSSVAGIVADYLTGIKAVQPHGPYYLIGECGGGILAFETARQLKRSGEKIGLLILFDTRTWGMANYLWRRVTERLRFRIRSGAMPWIWDYSRARLKTHLEEFRQLQGVERWRYALSKTAKAGLTIGYSLRQSGSTSIRDGNRDEPRGEIRVSSRSGEKSFFLAAHRYRYQRYDGPIILLVNEEWHAAAPTLGWNRFAGELEVHKIPGNHDACIPENIPMVAEILKESITRAEQATAARSRP